MTVMSDDIGKEITDAFGLKNCRKLTIYFEVGKIVMIEAETFPEENDAREDFSILKRYKLVEMEEETP